MNCGERLTNPTRCAEYDVLGMGQKDAAVESCGLAWHGIDRWVRRQSERHRIDRYRIRYHRNGIHG